jgi:hypothetical protein
VTENYVRESRTIFDNAEPEYERTHFNESTGGFVLTHKGHSRQNIASELFVAEALAIRGDRVWLLDEEGFPEDSTPDADVNGQLFDFKELSEKATNLKRSVESAVKRARDQGAKVVLIHINRTSYDLAFINRGFNSALLSASVVARIDAIGIVLQNKEVWVISTQDWINGRRF